MPADTPSLRDALEKLTLACEKLDGPDTSTGLESGIAAIMQELLMVADRFNPELCAIRDAIPDARAALAAPQVDPTDLETGKAIALTDAFLRHSTRDGEKRLNPAGELMAERIAAALSAARAQGEREERGRFAQALRRAATCCGQVVHHPDTCELSRVCDLIEEAQPSTEREDADV